MTVEKSSYPFDDLLQENFEDYQIKNDEWVSKDGRNKLIVTIVGGDSNAGWNGAWIKDVCLLSILQDSRLEVLRVQLSKNGDNENVLKNVFVEAIETVDDQQFIVSIMFSNASEGYREELNRVKCELFVSEDDNRLLRNLPKRIDVDETIRLFIEQLEERNFRTPLLISI